MGRTQLAAKALNSATWLLTAGAVALVVHERVVPWVRETAIVDPGESVSEPDLRDASTGDSVRFVRGVPTLVLVFRSTCPACQRALPGWREAMRSGAWQVLAVGLESVPAAAAYVGSNLPGARLVRPASPQEFTWKYRIRVVPTTLAIDREGRLALRRAGPLEADDLADLRRLVVASAH